jgi:hypothetical protein
VEVAVVGVIAKHRETDTDARDEIGRQQQNKMESWPSPENLGFLFYWIHKKILHFIGFTKKSCILLAFIGFHAKIFGARYFGVPGMSKNKKSSTFFHFVAAWRINYSTPYANSFIC